MTNEQTSQIQKIELTPQMRRARNGVGALSVSVGTAFVEAHDRLPLIGLEVVPNIISYPIIIGSAYVAFRYGQSFARNLRKDDSSN